MDSVLRRARQMAPAHWLVPWAMLVALSVACDGQDAGGDGRVDGGGADAELDAPTGDGDAADGDTTPARSGSLAFAVGEIEASTARWCDLDGDGSLDNAIADLGPADAAVFGIAMSTLIQGQADQGRLPLAYIPRVADLAGPDDAATMLHVLVGEDDDDLRGGEGGGAEGESYWIRSDTVGPCGEPLFGAAVSIDAGELESTGAPMDFPLSTSNLTLRGASTRGTLAPGGASAELQVCGYATIAQLGEIELSMGASLLATLISGGQAFGMPTVPGLAPDVDLDGDGLERVQVTDELEVESCVDGDLSVIDGADCWRDARIADGISLNFLFSGAAVTTTGPRPTWRWEVVEGCAAEDVDASTWGVCEAEACGRWERAACEGSCGEAGTRVCSWDCSGWSPCRAQDVLRWTPEACEEVTLEGEAACLDGPPRVVLASSPEREGALRLAERILVGAGPVTIEARVRVARGTTALPAFGWAIVAALNEEPSWIGAYDAAPAPHDVLGYAAQWIFSRGGGLDDERDTVYLVALRGEGSWSFEDRLASEKGGLPRPSLDSGTAGSVEQRLRLVIEPDAPETEANEMQAVTQISPDGGPFRSPGLSCFGDLCPVTVRRGDELVVGLTGSTAAGDAIIEVDLDGTSLAAEARSPCP